MIKFTEDREFDYGRGVHLHKAGDVVAVHSDGGGAHFTADGVVDSLREDKARRWLSRGAAVAYVAPVAVEEKSDDNPVDGTADVAGQDGGGDGQRAEPQPAASGVGAGGRRGGRGHK